MRSGWIVITLVLVGVAVVAMANYLPTLHGYSNPTIGLGFQYPKDWQLKIISEDASTHGDVMVNGRTSTAFTASLEGPSSHFISIAHGPSASPTGEKFDDRTVETQLRLIQCPIGVAGCQVLKNDHGVIYVRTESCDMGRGQCSLVVSIPTGKYIMSFWQIASTQALLDEETPVLDNLVKTIVLQ